MKFDGIYFTQNIHLYDLHSYLSQTRQGRAENEAVALSGLIHSTQLAPHGTVNATEVWEKAMKTETSDEAETPPPSLPLKQD